MKRRRMAAFFVWLIDRSRKIPVRSGGRIRIARTFGCTSRKRPRDGQILPWAPGRFERTHTPRILCWLIDRSRKIPVRSGGRIRVACASGITGRKRPRNIKSCGPSLSDASPACFAGAAAQESAAVFLVVARLNQETAVQSRAVLSRVGSSGALAELEYRRAPPQPEAVEGVVQDARREQSQFLRSLEAECSKPQCRQHQEPGEDAGCQPVAKRNAKSSYLELTPEAGSHSFLKNEETAIETIRIHLDHGGLVCVAGQLR